MAELERADLIRAINSEIALFQSTGDARFFWRAYLRLRAAGEPIPPDFLQRIDGFARALLSARTPQEIARALDLSGSTKKRGPKHAVAHARRWRIAGEVAALQSTFPGLSASRAIDAVAQSRGLSSALVRKMFYQALAKPRHKAAEGPPADELAAVLRLWRG